MLRGSMMSRKEKGSRMMAPDQLLGLIPPHGRGEGGTSSTQQKNLISGENSCCQSARKSIQNIIVSSSIIPIGFSPCFRGRVATLPKDPVLRPNGRSTGFAH